MVDETEVGEMDDALTWASPIAWRLIDQHGLNATFSQKYLSKIVDPQTPDTWVSYLDAMLLFLKFYLLNGYDKETQLDTFEEVNGRRPKTGFEEFRLQELFIAAMKHLRTETDPADVDKMATEAFAEIKESGLANAAPVVSYAPIATPLGVDQGTLQVVGGNLAKTETASQDSTTTLDTSIMAVLERMIEIKQSDEGGLEEKTANHYRSFGRLLIRVTGKDDVRQLTQKDATNFRKALISLPKSFGKSPSHHTRPVSEIIEAAKLLPRDKVGLSVPTVNRYLDQLGTLAAWADSEGISISDDLKPNKLRRRETKRAREKARTAKLQELRAIFSHNYWLAPMMVRPKGLTLARRRKSGLYWLPLIIAYTGARREEACGLTPQDCMQDEDGTWYFRIIENGFRRVKTMSSNRAVPIHSDLIELGLLDVISEAKNKGGRDILFPDIKEPNSKVLGRKVGRHFSKVVQAVLGQDGSGLTLQSMRHHFQHHLDLDREVPDKVCRDLLGHEGNDVHTRNYGDQTPMSELKFAVERLPRMVPDEIFCL